MTKYDVIDSGSLIQINDILENHQGELENIDEDMKKSIANNRYFRIIHLKKGKSVIKPDKIYVLHDWVKDVDYGGPVKFIKHRDGGVFIRCNKFVSLFGKTILI